MDGILQRGAPSIDLDHDPRVKSQTATINGKSYHWYLCQPDYEPKATVFLVHGFPDLPWAWRYQLPALLKLDLRVVVPDMIGYGRTDAPEDLKSYSMKSIASDFKEIARHVGTEQIILGGHDWGGFAVYRIAMHQPGLVSHIFSLCSWYDPPAKTYVSLEQMVTNFPFFGYMINLANPETPKKIGNEDIPQFLSAIYGGRTPEGEFAISIEDGVSINKMRKVGPSPLLTPEMLEIYVREFRRHSLAGPMSWYRTRKINWEDDQALLDDKILHLPILLICAGKDIILKPELADHMDDFVPNFTRKLVDASHWLHWEKPIEVNDHVVQWFSDVVFKSESKL